MQEAPLRSSLDGRQYRLLSKLTVIGLRIIMLVGFVMLQTLAFAQAPDAGRFLREQQGAQPQMPQRLPVPKPADEPAMPAVPADTGVRVRLQAIDVQGAQGLGLDGELAALTAMLVGQDVTFADIQALADQINRVLRRDGWLLARSVLPQQDLTDGRLRILIERARIEGSADGKGIQVNREAGARLNEQRAARTVAQAVFSRPPDTFNERDLERAVLLLGDLPGVQASSSLGPGQVDGTSALQIEIREGKVFTGSVWADNYGNRFTGRDRLSTLLSLNDPSGSGDQLILQATKSADTLSGRLNYSLPLGYSGLRAEVHASSLDYALSVGAVGSYGTARTVGSSVSFPLIRSRQANLNLGFGFDRKALQDNTALGNARDKAVDVWALTMAGDRQDNFWGGGLTNVFASVAAGQLDLSRNAADQVTDSTTAKTQGGYSKWNLTVARLQRLTDSLSLFASANAQGASKNLDSSEKLILGGPTGVRAYPSGEGAGDSGHVLNLETRLDLPALRALNIGDWQALAFYDTGLIQLYQKPFAAAPNATNSNRYRLSGAGLGVVLSRPGAYTVRAAWARAIGSNPGRSAINGSNSDGESSRNQLWLFAQFSF